MISVWNPTPIVMSPIQIGVTFTVSMTMTIVSGYVLSPIPVVMASNIVPTGATTVMVTVTAGVQSPTPTVETLSRMNVKDRASTEMASVLRDVLRSTPIAFATRLKTGTANWTVHSETLIAVVMKSSTRFATRTALNQTSTAPVTKPETVGAIQGVPNPIPTALVPRMNVLNMVTTTMVESVTLVAPWSTPIAWTVFWRTAISTVPMGTVNQLRTKALKPQNWAAAFIPTVTVHRLFVTTSPQRAL